MKRIYAPWRSVYLTSEKSAGCLFCEVPKESNDRTNGVLHRGTYSFVIINKYPYANGHVMVVCYRHVDHFGDLSDDETKEIMALVVRSENALRAAYKPNGINVGANIGESAGAGIVGHLHVHLVPRWAGDSNFMTSVGETRVISEDFGETYDRLASFYGSGPGG